MAAPEFYAWPEQGPTNKALKYLTNYIWTFCIILHELSTGKPAYPAAPIYHTRSYLRYIQQNDPPHITKEEQNKYQLFTIDPILKFKLNIIRNYNY